MEFFVRGHEPIIAVDFDGTLAAGGWPNIDNAVPNAYLFGKLREWRRLYGARIILWTCRCGSKLEDAVQFCAEYGMEFDAVNRNIPEMVEVFGEDSRKIFANVYIDDKAFHFTTQHKAGLVELDAEFREWVQQTNEYLEGLGNVN